MKQKKMIWRVAKQQNLVFENPYVDKSWGEG